ncbi:MAG: hypothetical protein ACE5KE_00300 [Methanosarcinales archaeon]
MSYTPTNTMAKPKSKRIIIRVNEPMYNFLKDIAKEGNMTMSEMLRAVIEYFYVGYLLGEWKKPLKELRKDFLKRFK